MIQYLKMWKWNLVCVFIGWIVGRSIWYRFHNPQLTETQLFLDMINLKWFL